MGKLTHTVSGTIAQFRSADKALIDSLKVSFAPVQSGSGDPTPTNIRPITGWTGLNVNHTGKNLLDDTYKTMSASDTRFLYWYNDNGIFLKRGEYYLSSSETVSIISCCNFNTKAVVSRKTNANQATITIPASDLYFFVFAKSSGLSMSVNGQLELLEYTEYEQGKLTEYAVDWTDTAGTVYGGTLDLATGALTKEWEIIASYNGETLPGEWISDRDVYAEGTTPTTGAQVAYELATPVTVATLTPVQLRTLLDRNNVWSSAGDVEVQYEFADRLLWKRMMLMIGGTEMVGELSQYKQLKLYPTAQAAITFQNPLTVTPKIVIVSCAEDSAAATSQNMYIEGILKLFGTAGGQIMYKNSNNANTTAGLFVDNSSSAYNARCGVVNDYVYINKITSSVGWSTTTEYTFDIYG